MDGNGFTLDSLLSYYEANLHAEGKSPKTIEWYGENLDFFHRYLIGHSLSTRVDDLTVDIIRGYIRYLQRKPKFQGHPFVAENGQFLSPKTIQCHVRTLKAFFSWLHREGYTKENRLEKLKLPKAPKRIIEPLSNDEINNLLAATNSLSRVALRDYAIVMTLLDTGLRASELMNLKMEDVHVEQGYVKVMGKGGKERLVPIGSRAQRALLRYIYHSRPDVNGIANVFLTLAGDPMSTNALRLMLSRLGRKSGVTRLHAHLCRHTFAVNYLLNGGDVFSLQAILGHSSIEMVRNYVALTSTDVTNQHRRFSPMDHIRLRPRANRPFCVRRRTKRKATADAFTPTY